MPHTTTVTAEGVPRHLKTKRAIRRVAVIGLGYVGLPLAVLAEERGLTVSGFDTDPRKVRALAARRAPFLSASEGRAFAKSRMSLSSTEAVLEDADAYIVCVPTPVDASHAPDLGPLKRAAESVGRHLAPGALVVIESTVNPGACESIVLPILERESGLKAERDFFFAHCPERINPGDTKWNVRTIPRVLGATGAESLARAEALYAGLTEADIVPMRSLKEAEAVKMVENAFRDVNIAFVNELAMSFAKADIDIVRVIQGAASKPFSFLPHFPGCGVGGHCIPVDPYYLIRYGKENGFEHRFLKAARDVNNGMPAYTVSLLEKALLEAGTALAGSRIALLGLAYKRDVPDLRESPALVIRDLLRARGAHVSSFDPLAIEAGSETSAAAALKGAAGAILATDHSALSALSPEFFLAQGVRIVVDGRNCLPKDAFLARGLAYSGIGR